MPEKDFIRVLARVRPSKRSVITESDTEIVLRDKKFYYDRVLTTQSKQVSVFEAVRPLIQDALDGYNATVFAYGQTGSGKTWTMSGSKKNPGIIPRTCKMLFADVDGERVNTLVTLTYVEIYKERIYDLLNNRKELSVMNFEVFGAKERIVDGASIAHVVDKASESRVTGCTSENDRSSRSHAILTLRIERSGISREGKRVEVVSRLRFVDLAGSEKAQGIEKAQETCSINRSLLHLVHILSLLSNKKTASGHIPYRNSRLTSVLKDALGGKSKCVMIACLRADEEHATESINTLKFASSAKKIVKTVSRNRSKTTRMHSLQKNLEGMKKALMDRSQQTESLKRLYQAMREYPSDHEGHMKILIGILGTTETYVDPEVDQFMGKSLRMTQALLVDK